MSDFENTARRLTIAMIEEGKITENQGKVILRYLKSGNLSTRIARTEDEELLASELLKVINEESMRVLIPSVSVSDDLSSPLDTYLQSQKKRTPSNPTGPSLGSLIRLE